MGSWCPSSIHGGRDRWKWVAFYHITQLLFVWSNQTNSEVIQHQQIKILRKNNHALLDGNGDLVNYINLSKIFKFSNIRVNNTSNVPIVLIYCCIFILIVIVLCSNFERCVTQIVYQQRSDTFFITRCNLQYFLVMMIKLCYKLWSYTLQNTIIIRFSVYMIFR